MELFTTQSFIVISQFLGIVIASEVIYIAFEKTIDLFKKLKDY